MTELFFYCIGYVCSFGLCYYFLTQLNLLKEKTIQYSDNQTEDIYDAIILLDTIRVRQEDFLWNYIEALRTNQPLPIAPNVWLTELEAMQNETLIKKRADIANAIKKQFGHNDFQSKNSQNN